MVNIQDVKKQLLFKDIDDRDLDKIGKKLKVLHFKPGEYLYRENEERKGFYLVNTGKVEVSNYIGGIESALFYRGPGEFCATLVVFGHKKHETNARATEETEVFLFPREDFEGIENEDIILAYLIFKNLAHIFSLNSLAMSRKITELQMVCHERMLRSMRLEA